MFRLQEDYKVELTIPIEKGQLWRYRSTFSSTSTILLRLLLLLGLSTIYCSCSSSLRKVSLSPGEKPMSRSEAIDWITKGANNGMKPGTIEVSDPIPSDERGFYYYRITNISRGYRTSTVSYEPVFVPYSSIELVEEVRYGRGTVILMSVGFLGMFSPGCIQTDWGTVIVTISDGSAYTFIAPERIWTVIPFWIFKPMHSNDAQKAIGEALEMMRNEAKVRDSNG